MSATAGMPETLETPVTEGMSTPVGEAARADTLDQLGLNINNRKNYRNSKAVEQHKR